MIGNWRFSCKNNPGNFTRGIYKLFCFAYNTDIGNVFGVRIAEKLDFGGSSIFLDQTENVFVTMPRLSRSMK